jgi:hypothetical protein
VAIGYNPVYKQIRNARNGNVVDYSFNVQNRGVGGGLRLNAATYCAIFSGEITNWNDSRITALNVNPATGVAVSLRAANDPVAEADWSLPIKVVVRDETSGTTALFTRHLRAACAQFQTTTVLATTTKSNLSAGFSQGFPGIDTGTAVAPATASNPNPCAMTGAVNTIFGGTWMRGRGSEGVAKCIGGNGTRLVNAAIAESLQQTLEKNLPLGLFFSFAIFFEPMNEVFKSIDSFLFHISVTFLASLAFL